MRTIGFVLLMLGCCGAAVSAQAQDRAEPPVPDRIELQPTAPRYFNPLCNTRRKAIYDFSLLQSFNKLGTFESSTTSAIGVRRQCLKDVPVQIQVAAGFDRTDVAGAITTAGRVGGGVFYYAKAPDEDATTTVSSLGIGANGYFGYEDFDIPVLTSVGTAQRKRGRRVAKSANVTLAYTVQDLTGESRFPLFPLGGASIHVTASYIDKRAPSADVPTYLNEEFFDLSAGISLDQFVDHDPFGSKINYFVGYERIFNPNYAVREIGTVRLQWRPQANPSIDNPDRLAVNLMYRFGANYRSISVGLSKSF